MTLTYHLPLLPDVVVLHLSDVHRFVAAHPFLERAAYMGGHDWMLTEVIRLAGIPLRFAYPATVTYRADERRVHMVSRINALVHLQLIFSIEADRGGTVVTEHIVIRALPPIRALFARIIRSAHQKLFASLAAVAAD